MINTAAWYPTPDPSVPAEGVWARALQINLTSNYVLAQEAAQVLKTQNLPASIVLTSSANAVVPKAGSEAYDVSKTAINHLIRELAVGLGPLIRVNGIAPATVIAGSSMFPRDRVIVALKKYNLEFSESQSTEELRNTAGGVLCAADDHAPADSADRQRECDVLAGRGSECQDNRARHPGRRRAAGGVSAMSATCYVLRATCDVPRATLDVGAGRRLRQAVVGIDVIDRLRRDELVFDEHGWRHRPAMEDIECDGDDFGAVLFGEVRDRADQPRAGFAQFGAAFG